MIESQGSGLFSLILPALLCCLISRAQRALLLNYKGNEDILVSGLGFELYGVTQPDSNVCLAALLQASEASFS